MIAPLAVGHSISRKDGIGKDTFRLVSPEALTLTCAEGFVRVGTRIIG